MGEKPSYDNYFRWVRDHHKVTINDGDKKYYYKLCKIIQEEFKSSPFWKDLISNFKNYEIKYLSNTSYELGILNFKPDLEIKKFDSVLLKSYRKNVQFNKNWPEEPVNGWILPDNFFKINDTVRTTLIVRYLDGIEFMVGIIEDLSKVHGLKFEKHYEARNEGYYAVHTYLEDVFEVPEKSGYGTEDIRVKIEIQITTQLKEVIRTIIHEYYSDRRVKIQKVNMEWAWKYEKEEFSVNYLGHMLHYLEGVIMNLREEKEL